MGTQFALVFLALFAILICGCCSFNANIPSTCTKDSDCASMDCKAATPYAVCLGGGDNRTGICGCSSSPGGGGTIATPTPAETPTAEYATPTPAQSGTPLETCPSGGGAISACPCTIRTPGTYTLAHDLATSDSCIRITADSATLDCNGHSISSSTDMDTDGIRVEGASGVTVKNCVLRGFNAGIILINSTQGTVKDNTGNSNRQCGLCLDGSTSNTISGNRLNSNTYDGVMMLHNSNSNTFRNNTCNSNMLGIYIHWDHGASGNTFTGNTVTGNSERDFHCEYTGAQSDGGNNMCDMENCAWLTCH